MKIALDAFGGDNSPQAIVKGGIDYLNAQTGFELVLTGDEAAVRAELSKYTFDEARVSVVHAPGIIGCDEQPTMAIKRKKDSSLVTAIRLVADKEADCVVSAGSTGALLAGATLIIRRMARVKRPALAPILPTRTGCVMLIDSGANADCKPDYLLQFAVMGSAYMKSVLGVESPRVGLINNGAEAGKGSELTKAAYKLLSGAPVNFAGNCEGRDIVSGDFDVAVCDGFTGNIVLKFMEGMAGTMMDMMKDEFKSSKSAMLGAALAKPALRRFKKKLDYTEYGGAPFLGVDGGVIKAHGSSNDRAVFSAMRQAYTLVDSGMLQIIRNSVADLPDTDD